METKGFIDVIEKLNEELYEEYGDENAPFSYSTNGLAHLISYQDTMLWNSEDDDREWIEDEDDYEPLEGHIRDVYAKWLTSLKTLKSKS